MRQTCSGPSTRSARPALGLGALALLLAGLIGCAPAAPARSGPGAAAPPAGAPAPAQPPAASAPAQAAPPAAPAPPAKLAVGYSSKGANQLPLWIAADRGYFAQQGIEAEVVFLSSTLTGQGLIANSVQLALTGPEGIDLNLESGSTVTTYVAGVTPKLNLKVFAQPDVRAIGDLRGKTIAATRQGSVTDFAWRKVLELNGLQLGRDVTPLYAGSGDAVLTSVIAGHAQAGTGSTPTDLVAQKQGLGILVDVAKLDIPYVMGGLVARTDYATATPDVMDRYLKAHLQGVHTMLTDAETAITVLGKYSEQDDREFLRAGYEFFLPTMTRDQLMPEAAIVATLQESPRPNARDADPKSFYDNSYLERIIASGFLDRLYGGR
jgi:ABC-type nitrate/sulfonate/bicarbonate transport system substrate-binding protein